MTNAITATVLARLLTPEPLGPRRILLASLAYGLFFVGLYTFVGVLVGTAARAA